MTQKLPQRFVLMDHFVKTVKVAIQTLHHHTHHKNLPQLHPRPTQLVIDIGNQALLQEGKQSSSPRRVRIQLLKTDQYGGSVIPGFVIQINVFNVNITQLAEGINRLSIASSLEESLHLVKIRPYYGKTPMYKPILKRSFAYQSPYCKGFRNKYFIFGQTLVIFHIKPSQNPRIIRWSLCQTIFISPLFLSGNNINCLSG